MRRRPRPGLGRARQRQGSARRRSPETADGDPVLRQGQHLFSGAPENEYYDCYYSNEEEREILKKAVEMYTKSYKNFMENYS